MSDTWPPLGPQRPEPLLEHIRDVWVLHGIEQECVAGLYRTAFGIELRLHLDDELTESRLSRYGEAPLLLITEQAKQNLLTARLCASRSVPCLCTKPLRSSTDLRNRRAPMPWWWNSSRARTCLNESSADRLVSMNATRPRTLRGPRFRDAWRSVHHPSRSQAGDSHGWRSGDARVRAHSRNCSV